MGTWLSRVLNIVGAMTIGAGSGSEIAFLSDSGGHGNLWVLSNRTGNLRQITFEANPAVAVGVPVWSPDGRSIAFVSSKGRTGFDFGVWLVDPHALRLKHQSPIPTLHSTFHIPHSSFPVRLCYNHS